MSYVVSAYAYDGINMPKSFLDLLELDEYKSSIRKLSDILSAHDSIDIGNIGVAFTGAQLYLSSDLFLRFNLRTDFTGTLNVDGTEYSVTDGKVGELGFIECKLPPRSLYAKKITVTGTGNADISGEYSLEAYIKNLDTDNDLLGNLLTNLYIYCYEAYVYENEGVLPPYVDNTPVVDMDFIIK